MCISKPCAHADSSSVVSPVAHKQATLGMMGTRKGDRHSLSRLPRSHHLSRAPLTKDKKDDSRRIRCIRVSLLQISHVSELPRHQQGGARVLGALMILVLSLVLVLGL